MIAIKRVSLGSLKIFHHIQNSGIWAKPNSENYTQCIGHPNLRKSNCFYLFIFIPSPIFLPGPNVFFSVCAEPDMKTNGYILINANGGLNQMRFGV